MDRRLSDAAPRLMLPEGVKFWIWPCYRIEYMGRATNLPDMPGSILSVLLSRPGKRWTTEELIKSIYPDDEDGGPASNTVAVGVTVLRSRLRNRGIDPIIISHGRASGYTLIGFELYNNGRPWWA